jgi:hypothetical protein
MIREKIAQAKDLIDKVSIEQVLVSRHKQYAAFFSELEDSLPLLNDFQRSSQILQEQCPDHFSRQNVTGIINKINVILTGLQNGSEPPKKNMVTQISEDVKVLEKELKVAWQEYVSKTTQNSLGLLESIKGILNDFSKIDDTVKKLLQVQKQWPVLNKTFHDLTGALTEARQIIQDLNAGDDVHKFLDLVSSRKARVSDLKPEILDWLRRQELTDNLEITFANSQRRI